LERLKALDQSAKGAYAGDELRRGVPGRAGDNGLLHDPAREVWIGMSGPGAEVAERATRIRDALIEAGSEVVRAVPHDDSVLLAVHDRDLVEHLAGVYEEWVERGYPGHGQDRVVPYVFPTPGMLDGLPAQVPYATHGRAGLYGYDTMTLVGPGTWAAARGAVDEALTAVDLVASGSRRVAYALCRPPGHHVTRRAYGGSCYLNNAAVAAVGLRRAGFDWVAVVDIDAHHGNGSQACRRRRDPQCAARAGNRRRAVAGSGRLARFCRSELCGNGRGRVARRGRGR
jgi:acetoin utilization deacetylase AcuC-like enzyme